MLRSMKKLKTKADRSKKEYWYLEPLSQKYSEGDVGLFALFFLNYRELQAGEAVFFESGCSPCLFEGKHN